MPRAKDPQVAGQLLAAAARLLDDEGRPAVTARRLAAEVGTSTMAVYTHFGGMDDLLVALLRDGFARFGDALDGAPLGEDPVADWVAQGWSYRRFALDNRHLYRVMFGDGLPAAVLADPADHLAAAATFTSLLDRLQRCADAERLRIDDVVLAGQVVWAAVHGHVSIELSGYFDSIGRDPVALYEEVIRRLALAFGDDADRVERSIEAATTGALDLTRR